MAGLNINCLEFELLFDSDNCNDTSGYSRNGTATDVTYDTGHTGTGKCAVFNGTSSYIYVPRMISDDFTISFWFKSTQGRGSTTSWYDGAGLVDAEVSGVSNDFGTSLNSTGYVLSGTGNPDKQCPTTSGGLNDGNWHHVVFVRDMLNGTLKLYVDNSLVNTITGCYTSSLTSATNINIGRIQTGANYFSGSIDNIRIYSKQLLSAEINSLYTETDFVPQSNINLSSLELQTEILATELSVSKLSLQAEILVNIAELSGYTVDVGLITDNRNILELSDYTLQVAGIFTVDTPTVSTEQYTIGVDSSTSLLLHGNGANNTTPVADSSLNKKTIVNTGSVLNQTPFTKFGTASLYFNGSNYLYTAQNTDFNFGSGDFTIDMWVYSLTTKQWQGLISQRTTGSSGFAWQVMLNSMKVRFEYSTNGSSTSGSDFNTTLSPSTWYHIAIVRSGSTVTCYINGVAEATTINIASNSIYSSTDNVQLGSLKGDGHYLYGYLDEVRVSKGKAHWKDNFTPPKGAYETSRSGLLLGQIS